jgi:hypothetical protein
MARPISWPDKITAPEEALEFYRHVSKLQRSEAFKECHVFDGALIHDVPHVRWEKTTTNLPRMICGFLGLPYRRQHCNTKGCMNPFHFVDVNRIVAFHSEERLEVPLTNTPNLEEYVELVKHIIDANDLKLPVTFTEIRPLIEAEDMDDTTLINTLLELHK